MTKRKEHRVTTIWYSTGDEHRYAMEISSVRSLHRPREQRDIAEECAADFHDRHDGWECDWPRQFVLYDSPDGPALTTLTVDRETVPHFVASRDA